jgi:hypothetical protein
VRAFCRPLPSPIDPLRAALGKFEAAPEPSAALTNLEQKANIQCMDDRDRLALYPFLVVRIACRVCSRSGSYRLARLASKYGAEISLRDLTERFSYDCLWRAEARSKKGKSACGVYLPELEHKRPPDLPPGMVKLRLVKGD